MVTSSPVRGARALLAVASLAVMLAAADTYVVVLALPDMMAGVGLGIESLQRGAPIISGFLLGYIAVLPLIGRLADLVPRRKILIGCLLIFALGSAVTALAADLNVLVGGRLLQGIGGGGLVPATLAMVADLWPPGKRGTPLGVVGGVQELGAVLGPLLGAAILLVTDWRGIFWLNVLLALLFIGLLLVVDRVARGGRRNPRRPRGSSGAIAGASPFSSAHPSPGWRVAMWLTGLIAAALWLLTLIAPESLVTSVAYGEPFIPFGETATSRVWTPVGLAATIALLAWASVTATLWWPVLRQVDLLGALLIAVALGSLVLTFSSAEPETEVLGPLGWWLLPVGGLAVVAFAIRQKMAAAPLIPNGVVRARVWPALGVSLLVGVAIVAIVVDVPLLARLDGESTQTEAAIVLVRFLIAVPIGAVFGGLLLRWLGPGLVAAVGLAGTTAGLVVMSGWDRASLGAIWETTWVLGLVGLGVGMAIAPVNDAALADSRADAHGTVSSLVVLARMVGMVVGLAALTAYGLRQFYAEVALLPDQTDTVALLDAGVVQVQSVFSGAALAAGIATILAVRLGLRREGPKA